MPAIDQCEAAMLRAFEKDGWVVFRRPYPLPTAERTVYADLSLFRPAVVPVQIIVVEVKCFRNPSRQLDELYRALGQMGVYQAILDTLLPDTPLYLAMPTRAFQPFQSDAALMRAVQQQRIRLIIVDDVREEIAQWIEN